MAGIFQDWLGMMLRWAHIITGIAWIGSSFYFVWLDISLRQRNNLPEGAIGESWSVHGGGFYHVQKYLVAPPKLPDEVHWFKYESYFTWLTGLALMGVIYYWSAESYLIDAGVLALEAWQAIAISIGALAAGWLVYDLLCKSPVGKNTLMLAVCVFVFIVAASAGFAELFSPRAAFLHVGAMIGTIMTGNVFFVIIPNQKMTVAALKEGREPDTEGPREAKQRSFHNNYLTLPVLLMMISNHYPVLFGYAFPWLVVAVIVIIGGVIRDFFNTYNAGAKGRRIAWQWPLAAALTVSLMMLVHYRPDDQRADDAKSITAEQAVAIVQTRCISCHAERPSDKDFDKAPGGLKFDDLRTIKVNASRILAQTVLSNAMPLANKTGMTTEERNALGDWIRRGMSDD